MNSKLSIREVLMLVVIGCFLATAGYLTYRLFSAKKHSKAQADEIYALQHAPIKIDTVMDTIHLPGGVKIKPIIVREEKHDTIWIQEKLSWYDSTYSKEGIRFRWKAKAIGELSEIEFSNFVWPKTTITVTKSIDTCFSKPPEYRAKLFHWGVYTEAVLQNLTEFPGIGIGGQLIVKDRMTISAGGVYLNGLYGNVRVGVLLK